MMQQLLVIRLRCTAKPVAGRATPEVRLVLALVGSMTRRELQDALDLRDDEHFRTAYLVPALDAGLIEMMIPDKPSSRLQKDRLTALGQVLRDRPGGGVGRP